MKYLSLFSGIGGFELGINQSHRKWLNKNQLWANDPECVGFSEIDKYAIQIYKKHFPHHKNYGDITRINEKELPDFELLVGGFPCQSFSIAGKRGGFEDTRGTLFFEIARILKYKKPRLFLLENVKGLLSHDDGKTFRVIITTLDELGYDLQWQVCNSKNFGVPQNRERVLIVGHLRGTPRPEVFPFRESDRLSDTGGGSRETSGGNSTAITSNYKRGVHSGGETYAIGTLRTHKDGQGFREIKGGISPTIPARAREDGSGQPVIRQRARGFNKGGDHEISPTLGSHAWEHNNHLNGLRRLTPIECERLQGFPDYWTEYGLEDPILFHVLTKISDSQRYKCLGNAVTVNVIEAIISKLL